MILYTNWQEKIQKTKREIILTGDAPKRNTEFGSVEVALAPKVPVGFAFDPNGPVPADGIMGGPNGPVPVDPGVGLNAPDPVDTPVEPNKLDPAGVEFAPNALDPEDPPKLKEGCADCPKAGAGVGVLDAPKVKVEELGIFDEIVDGGWAPKANTLDGVELVVTVDAPNEKVEAGALNAGAVTFPNAGFFSSKMQL